MEHNTYHQELLSLTIKGFYPFYLHYEIRVFMVGR